MTRFLLDSGIATDYIDRRNGVFDRARAETLKGNRVGTAVPILAELVAGIERSRSRDRNLQSLRAAGTITSPLSLQSLAWLVASAGDHIMHPTPLHQCRCPDCLQATDHPNKEVHRQLNLLLSRLNEQQRRWLAAWEAQRIGHGGDRLVSSITGLHVQTIRRGRQELGSAFANLPPGRVRRPGAGRPPLEKKIRSWSETW
ncbi:hypothetical protein [Fimbriiglobus ruber]|uniref:hypothetical protein n=1 Tax=Fimbriiglobus ruber TaxID=1908690 RepID=UPI000B4A798A|nr:hypothetical protein [Fimbriiglobus ruber]